MILETAHFMRCRQSPGLFVCSACYLPEAFSTLASATPKCTESLDETSLEASSVNAACRINSQLAPCHLDNARSMSLKMMVPRRKHSLSGENRSALSLVKYQNPRFAISPHFVLSAVLGIAVPASAETSSLTELEAIDRHQSIFLSISVAIFSTSNFSSLL